MSEEPCTLPDLWWSAETKTAYRRNGFLDGLFTGIEGEDKHTTVNRLPADVERLIPLSTDDATVERVASTIFADEMQRMAEASRGEFIPPAWDLIGESGRNGYRKAARTVLAVLMDEG